MVNTKLYPCLGHLMQSSILSLKNYSASTKLDCFSMTREPELKNHLTVIWILALQTFSIRLIIDCYFSTIFWIWKSRINLLWNLFLIRYLSCMFLWNSFLQKYIEPSDYYSLWHSGWLRSSVISAVALCIRFDFYCLCQFHFHLFIPTLRGNKQISLPV